MKKIILFSICNLLIFQVFSQKNLAEKLGYDKNAKLLIIHADDLGVSHSENMASFEALENGSVNSASIMMPTPWVTEVAEYAKKHKNTHDLGLHLTLTAEWEPYKWSSVAPKDKVSSLINSDGYFYDNCAPNAIPSEIEIELRAQIEMSLTLGINPTHLDTHMGCLVRDPKIFAIYLKLGREYNIPCLINKNWIARNPEMLAMIADKEIVVDAGFGANTSHFDIKNGMADYYTKALKSMKSGLNRMTVHIAYDDAEMQAVTVNKKYYGADWRQQDFDFFTSEICKQIIKEENIKLVTWREITNALNN